MSWPNALHLVRIHVSAGSNPLGEAATGTLTIQANLGNARSITWADTHDTLLSLLGRVNLPDVISIPAVDQDGWRDPSGRAIKNWSYTARLTVRSSTETRVIERTFRVLADQDDVDFYDLPSDETASPDFAAIPAVTSVNGQTGAVRIAAGGGSASGAEYVGAGSTWSIAHSLGRRPVVALYDVDGTPFESDIVATATHVVVTHPSPVNGTIVLS